MNKQNRKLRAKCIYCSNEATGIIYRPKNELDNVLACTTHATNLFIPFKDTTYDQKQLSESRYRSPMKQSPFSISALSDIPQTQKSPELFFDKLMENIIHEFNSMKKEIMINYNKMKNLHNTKEALQFKIQGDASYPYMIINNDEEMMMNMFVTRILRKNHQQDDMRKREQVHKRRMELSTILSSQQHLPQIKSLDSKEGGNLFWSRSIPASPHKTNNNDVSIDKTNTHTQRKPLTYRDYCMTQKRQKK